MSVQNKNKKLILLAAMPILMLATAPFAMRAMESGTYQINTDSINFGGNNSESALFDIEDTAGEIATGDSESATYQMRAGYQQMHGSYLALSMAGDVTMSPSINGLTGGQGNGSTTWNVVTDNAAGYLLQIRAGSSPAMQDGQGRSFSDYTTQAANPDYGWTVPSTEAEFGFSPEGEDVASRYLDNGASCNTGTLDSPDACWDAFSTTEKIIAQRSGPNHPSGTNTVVKFRAEVGNQKMQVNSNYSANITVTALPL